MISVKLFILIVLLIGMASVASWVLLRTSREEKEIAERLATITAQARPKAAVALPSITKKEISATTSPKERLANMFGFSLARTAQYTMRWPVVIGIALVLGRIAVMLGSGLLGLYAWIMMPVVTIVISRQMFGSMVNKRMNKLRDQLPEAIGLIVRAVRVGVPVTEALRAVGREAPAPTGGEFTRLADDLGIGTSLDSALRDMSDRNGLPEYGFFAAALTLQAQTGGGLADTLELLAEVSRKRSAMRARGHALSSEARTSSLILACLPLVSGGSLYLINPGYLGLLFTEPMGQMILGSAVLSLGLGVFVMRTIISSALRV